MISVYIPLYNSADWCRQLQLLDGFQYIASDNCSTDGSGDILREKGVKVVTQTENLGRVGNWEFCLRHFMQSEAVWMKWLFTGDAILPDAYGKLEKAIHRYPEIKLIFAAYYAVDGSDRQLRQAFPETQIITPEQSLRYCAERGNFFGSPVSYCFHKDAILSGFSLGDRPWVADMQLCMSLAAKFPLLYLTEPIGEFNLAQRLYRAQYVYSVSTAIDEYFIRQEAAIQYKSLTGDTEGFEQLMPKIDRAFETAIVERALNRAETPEDSAHIIHPIQQHPNTLAIITSGLSTRKLISTSIARIVKRLKF